MKGLRLKSSKALLISRTSLSELIAGLLSRLHVQVSAKTWLIFDEDCATKLPLLFRCPSSSVINSARGGRNEGCVCAPAGAGEEEAPLLQALPKRRPR